MLVTSRPERPSLPPQAHAPGRPALDAAALRRRWELVLPHRAELLAIARRRVASREDAEDVVNTALVRTVEHPGLDESRVGAFLCTTVTRLAVDVHRDRTRQLAVGRREATRQLEPAPVDERVCDEAEAQWLAQQLRSCPPRERDVLQARLQGLTAGQTSQHLGMSAKATENALTRVRQRANSILASTLTLVGLAFGMGRRLGRSTATMVPAAAMTGLAAVTLAVPVSGPVTSAVVVLEDRALPAPPVSGGAPAEPAAPEAGPAEPDQVAPPPPPPPPVEVRPVEPAAPPAAPPVDRIEMPLPAAADPVLPPEQRPYAEERHQDETFEQTVERCVQSIDLANPLADPCQ